MEYDDDSNYSSSSSSSSSSVDHLIVMVNGTGGSAKDWMFATKQFVTVFPDNVFVHRSKQNVGKLAKDGVDIMGERLAREVIEVIERKSNLRKISFLAYSVGGLVARYAIGRLHKTPEIEPMQNSSNAESNADSVGTICGLRAMNFITLATPHLGLSGHKQLPILFGKTKLEKIARKIASWTDGKTGRHLFLTDGAEQKDPLLLSMVTDSNQCYFISALRAFKRRVVYANVINDHVVGWRTASIRGDIARKQWDGIHNEYPHVVYEEDCQACDPVENNRSYDIQEEMLKGLSSVAWEKVDVSFNNGLVKFEAHSLIQVTHPSRHIEGADVIQHMIDHFLT